MKRLHRLTRSTKGFTLIELLVVIGIIAVLASGVGLALRGNNPDASLRAAQGIAVGALSSARGQAALTQSNARIIVQADNTDANFLRSVRIVVPDSTTPGNWKQVGGEIILPENVFIVPPSAGSLVEFEFAIEYGPWNVGRNSTLFKAATESVSGLSAATKCLVSEDISPLGTVNAGRIVVTPGRRTSATTITLDNPSAVRGLVVSRYGVATLVNEATSFDLITP